MRLVFFITFIFLSLLDEPVFSKPIKNRSSYRSNTFNLIKDSNFFIGSYTNLKEPKWKEVAPEVYKTNDVKWKKIKEAEEYDFLNNNNDDFTKISNLDKVKRKLYNDQIELTFINLGRAVPTANTLNIYDLNIRFEQIAPIKGAYYTSGTGNQNYEASIYYGLSDKVTIEAFISHSDDPLHKRIKNYSDPVENRWINYGSAIKWQSFKNNNILIALNASIENWNVKSGGCNTYNCDSTSNNIFTSKREEVINNNIIGSFSIPITWKVSDKLDFTVTPRSIFLPSNQSKGSTSSQFYNNNYGLGTGLEYKIYKNLKTYSSVYFPIGDGYNSFDGNLIYKRNPIYNAGLAYSLDTKFSLEAGLSNGFGMSPSIGILTLPSSDQLLYKTALIYRPSNMDWPESKDSMQESLRFGGLSVSNAELLNTNEKKISYSYNSNGSWSNDWTWGASKLFNFDLSLFSIGQKSHVDNKLIGEYHGIDKLNVRGGGKARFFSQSNGDLLTSGARVSAGRLRGWGWIFTELVNTYSFNENLSININPKLSLSGLGNPSGLGTSLNWEILKGISIIPEFNFALRESTDNWTIALRYSKIKNTYVDLYTTNALSFVDTGQLFRSDNQSFGINIGYIF